MFEDHLAKVSLGPLAGRLLISVKRARWRMHSEPDTEMRNAEYVRNRLNRMESTGYTCQFCGFQMRGTPDAAPGTLLASGFLEAHHMDDDHCNNDPRNLVPACPFCHSVFHIGYAGWRKGAVLIWLPELPQAHLNLLCHAMLAGLLTEETEEAARRVYNMFRGLAGRVDERFSVPGGAASHPAVFGKALGHLKDSVFDNRKDVLQPLRLLPDLDRYKEAGSYWLQTSWRAHPPQLWEPLTDAG